MRRLVSCKLQDRDIGKLQVPRYIDPSAEPRKREVLLTSKIGTMLRCQLQNKNIAKLQVARQ